jgi:hypothetical protein
MALSNKLFQIMISLLYASIMLFDVLYNQMISFLQLEDCHVDVKGSAMLTLAKVSLTCYYKSGVITKQFCARNSAAAFVPWILCQISAVLDAQGFLQQMRTFYNTRNHAALFRLIVRRRKTSERRRDSALLF